MKALLIVAHGSRLQKSNDEVIELAARLQRSGSVKHDLVQAAFLELTTPLISQGIQRCVEAGATQITVFPYFLNSGRHVVTDIPGQVSEATKQYADVKIKVMSHLGAADSMIAMISGLINAFAAE
ncbi:MAG: CbiX/SirB N-terminal domain-containing protein [Kiritimatiellae bacterium]|nr:CbiX/SirB N-terminal domain-containing protein [Kiritimatiellia bacterium]